MNKQEWPTGYEQYDAFIWDSPDMANGDLGWVYVKEESRNLLGPLEVSEHAPTGYLGVPFSKGGPYFLELLLTAGLKTHNFLH